MGSGCETAHETVEYLAGKGEKVGVVKVRLYRPFDVKRFLAALPPTVKSIAVLDRTKEAGAIGEPLYLDVIAALAEGLAGGFAPFKTMPRVIGGRYGLSSKEFTPAMIKAVFDNLNAPTPKNHFTVGIIDDVAHTSLEWDPEFSTESDDVIRGLFYGLGSDGTVGANKNSIKIIGENTPFYAQGYFVYDSKKAGAMTVSHVRFGPRPIRSTYLVSRANFVGCHQFIFLEKYDMLANIMTGGTFLLNAPFSAEEVWDKLPRRVQEHIIQKKLKFYTIDATRVARDTGMGGRINTIMQTCWFALSGVLPRDQAIEEIKNSIKKTYGRKGEEIVRMNIQCVEQSLANLFEVKVPAQATSQIPMVPPVSPNAPEYVQKTLGRIIGGQGDLVPVSGFAPDGTFPTATAQWEKRNLALEIPVWEPDLCIQCGKCVMVCPHATIRIKVYDPKELEGAPSTFKHCDARVPAWKSEGLQFTLQVAPEDCTGCALCVDICPAKDKTEPRRRAINMQPQPPLRESERANWEFFLALPDLDRAKIDATKVREQQVQRPLFEFSGACAGCGETPYVKLVTQLFGDRMLIANATGCSSIYGANLPTTPYCVDATGRGPAWNNSLFEDNAEFGLGFRLALDRGIRFGSELLRQLAGQVGENLAEAILGAEQVTEAGIAEQRVRVAQLKKKLEAIGSPEARRLLALADFFIRRSVWIIGGDGWAYDIGYGGLDHVLASGRDVNILVLDTEVYSNTGGQMSKATPRGAIAKFAAGGKPAGKKDLGMMAMTYGNVYVARVAMGANDVQTLRAFIEAEAYRGPSIIIAYCHCIAHGIDDMAHGMQNQKMAVDTGQCILYRFNPERAAQGLNPLQLDSKAPRKKVEEFLMMEGRFKMLRKINPAAARQLFEEAQQDVLRAWSRYEYLASQKFSAAEPAAGEGGEA